MIPTSTIGGPMEFILRLMGIWPDSSCVFAQRVFWTTTMTAAQIFQYWYLFTHIGSGNLSELMDSMSLCISNSLLFLKLNVLWLNRRIVYGIFATMADDWTERASKDRSKTMTSKAILSHRFAKYIISAYTMSVGSLTISNLLAVRSAGYEQPIEERLLFKMTLPFECGASPFYEIVLVTQFLLQYTLALMAAMLNALMVTLALHIAGQIEIMCDELLEIPVAEDKRETRAIMLRALVNKHQRIIAFADSIENAFCYMSLMQFFSNTLVICFLGFMIVTSLDSIDVLIKCTPYYVVVNIEAFILCFTGEYLSTKSRSISQAAYESLWYELRPTESRILLLLMLRSQKQLAMTAGKFMELSLESFTSILKASASYVSVLHAMY